MKERVNLRINGEDRDILIEPWQTLLSVLRDNLDLTGAKNPCGVGDCGACTVLVNGRPTCSCLTLAVTVKEKEVLTIEGLAEGTGLHPIQKAFIDYGAVQCGFCSPGMILMAKALLDENPDPKRDEVKTALAGNLCRCTGYVKITDAILAAAETMQNGG